MIESTLLLHDVLHNRLECEGVLLMETALHIGTGQSSPTTDAGVVRDYQGRPFIPGSSLKGALRSAVERRVEWLGLTSCRLAPDYRSCLSARLFTDNSAAEEWRGLPLEERKKQFDEQLCDTCKLFGSVAFAAKVQIDDLPLVEDLEDIAVSLTEVRDGVGIDRDSGTAVEGVKFDYEVVASLTPFRFCLTAENLGPAQFALLSLGLLEMANGTIPLGGKSTRGLGRCRLHLHKLYHVEFPQAEPLTLAEQVLDHLRALQERQYGIQEDPRAFLLNRVQSYLEGKRSAQETDQ